MTHRTSQFFLILIVTAIAGIAFLAFSPKAFAAFNRQINYQGKLTTSSNIAVTDGTYNVRFKLYTTLTGGAAIWTETWCFSPDSGSTCNGTGLNSRIQLTNGLFSTMLGSTTALDGIDFNQTLYLGVEIGGTANTPAWDGEMSPRKKLGAVPAAFIAEYANTLQGFNAAEFIRSDATNSTSTASTFLSIVQLGAGRIAEFFGTASRSVLSLLSGGNVGVGTTTPTAKLAIHASYTDTNTTLFAVASSTINATTTLFSIQNNGTVQINTSGVTPSIYNPSSGNGLILRGDTSGAQLRIVSNSGAWTDATTTSYFQMKNNNNTNVSFMGGTYGTDTILNRLQFNASSTQFADNTYGSTPIPTSVFEIINNTATKMGLKVRGATSQTADIFSVQNISGSSLLNVTAAGNVGVGTTSPNWKLSVSGAASFDAFARASFFVATSTATSTFAGGIQTNLLNVTSTTATSTFANGIDLTKGCFSINNTCIGSGGGSGSGTVNSGLAGQIAYYNANGTAVTGTSTIFITPQGAVGVGVTTPTARLEVQGTAEFDGTGTITDDGTGLITGVGTAFTTELAAGDFITIPGEGTYGYVVTIYSNTSMLVNTPTAAAGEAFTYRHPILHAQNQGGSSALLVGGDGNVGVNLVSPSSKLQVNGTFGVGGNYVFNTQYYYSIKGLIEGDMSKTTASTENVFMIGSYDEFNPLGLVVRTQGGATSDDRSVHLQATEVGVTPNILLINPDGGNVGVGATSSPWRKFTVVGSSDLGTNAYAGNFTASSMVASRFPYASTTGLTVSGINGLYVGSLTGPLQAINGAVSATSTIATMYGGTGISTLPSYGNVLLGNALGGYTLTATSSLGITSSQWTTNGTNIYYNTGYVGIGSSTPARSLSVQGSQYIANSLGIGSFNPNKILALGAGSSTVSVLRPSADGAASGLFNNSGNHTNNYTYVDDVTSDGDTTYVGADSSLVDYYNLNDPSIVGNVSNVQVCSVGRDTGLGTDLTNYVYVNSTPYNAVAFGTIGTSYATYCSNWPLNPNSGVLWTSADIDSLQAGVRLVIGASLPGNAQIETPMGNRRMDSLAIGDEIYSYDGNTKVIDHVRNFIPHNEEHKALTHMVFNGTLDATDNHPIYTINRGYVKAGEIVLGDILLGTNLQPVTVNSITSYVSTEMVYDITVEHNNNFFANGYLVHNVNDTGRVTQLYVNVSYTPPSGADYFTVDALGTTYLAGNLGVGSTSPNWKLSVNGSSSVDGFSRASFFVATSSIASTLPYASTTALTVSGTASTTNLIISGLGGVGTRCLQVGSDGTVAANASACGTGGGSSSTWSTTTSQVANQLINYSNNSTDIVAIGSNSTTTAKFWFDPNAQRSYFSGNVGIGTTTPFAELDVTASGQSYSSTPSYAMYVSASNSTRKLGFGYDTTIDAAFIQSVDYGIGFNKNLILNPNGGNVGVGTTTPYSRFSVWGTSTGTNRLFELTNSASTTLATVQENGTAYFLGNMGVGTTSPNWKLSVNGSASFDGFSRASFFTATSTSFASQFPYASTTMITSSSTAYLALASGSVSIGTTTPYSKLSVWGSGTAGNRIFELTNSASTTLAAVQENGTAYFFGNTGIGTTSPNWKLSVNGSASVDGFSRASFFTATSTSVASQFPYASTTMITSSSTAYLALASGSVSVGTTTPYAKLSVWGTGTTTGQTFAIMNSASSTLFQVLDNGNVGVGTTSPFARFSVNGAASFDGFVRSSFFTATSTTATSTFAGAIAIGTTSANHKLTLANDGVQFNYIPGNTTPVTLNLVVSAGNLGVGQYNYRIAWITPSGITDTPAAGDNSITTTGGSQQVTVTRPTMPFGATGWRIYRTKVSGSLFAYFMVADIQNTTTSSYQDNIADSSLQGARLAFDAATGNTVTGRNTSAGTHFLDSNSVTMDNLGGLNFSNIGAGLSFNASGKTDGYMRYKDYWTSLQAFGGSTSDTSSSASEWCGQGYDTSGIWIMGCDGSGSYTAHEVRILSSAVGAPLFLSIKRGQTAPKGWFDFNEGGTSVAGLVFARFQHDSWSAASGVNTLLSLANPAIGQSGSAGYRILDINTTQTSNGTGVSELLTVRDGTNYKFLVNNAGNAGIGTSTPWGKLAIAALSTNTTPLISVSTSTVNSTSTAFIIDSTGRAGIATSSPWRTFDVNGTVGFKNLTNNGTANYLCLTGSNEVSYSTTACSGLSSAAFKHDIDSLTLNGLDQIARMRPVAFTYNTEVSPGDQSRHLGFIAEEINLINPNLVAFDKDGTVKSVKYDEFTPIIVKAIQEQQLQIAALQALVGSTTAHTYGGGDYTPPSTQTGVVTVSDIVILSDRITDEIAHVNSRIDALTASTSDQIASSSLAAVTTILAPGSSLISSIVATSSDTLASSTSFIGRIANSVMEMMSSAGGWVLAKITATLGVFVGIESNTASIQHATIGTASISEGLEMKDRTTGAVYCVIIDNGNFSRLQGTCSPVASSTPPTQVVIPPVSTPPVAVTPPPTNPPASSTPPVVVVPPPDTTTPPGGVTPPVTPTIPPAGETPPPADPTPPTPPPPVASETTPPPAAPADPQS